MGARASSRDTAQEPTHLSPRPLVLKPAGPNSTHPNPTCPQTHWPQPSSSPGPLIPTPLLLTPACPQPCSSQPHSSPTLLVPRPACPHACSSQPCLSPGLPIPTPARPNPAHPQARPSPCPLIPTPLLHTPARPQACSSQPYSSPTLLVPRPTRPHAHSSQPSLSPLPSWSWLSPTLLELMPGEAESQPWALWVTASQEKGQVRQGPGKARAVQKDLEERGQAPGSGREWRTWKLDPATSQALLCKSRTERDLRTRTVLWVDWEGQGGRREVEEVRRAGPDLCWGPMDVPVNQMPLRQQEGWVSPDPCPAGAMS